MIYREYSPANLESHSPGCSTQMNDSGTIRKAVIPAAGRGSRLYPLTKAQPKEMMPVGPRPAIQAVVEELGAAGITDILVITGPGKSALEEHLDPNAGRLSAQEREPWAEAFSDVQVRIFYTRQNPPCGLGEAIACAADFVGGDDFVVALGDSIIIGGPVPVSQRLIQAHLAHHASATLGVQQVRPEYTSRHGILDVAAEKNGVLQVQGIIEKPSPQQAPSNWAVCGRYVLAPAIFTHLDHLQAGYGGEFQLTDAIAAMIAAGELVQAVPLGKEELRLDVGNFVSYSRAFVRATVNHPQLGREFREYLCKLVAYLEDSNNPDPDRLTTQQD